MQKTAQLLIISLSSSAFSAAFANNAHIYNTSTVLKHLTYNSSIRHHAGQLNKTWQKPSVSGELSQPRMQLASARPAATPKSIDPKQFPGEMWKPKDGKQQFPGRMWKPKNGKQQFPGGMWKPKDSKQHFPGGMW